MKPGKRNRKGLDMYQTREKIQSIILLLADLICFAVSYFGGGYLWLVGYRNVSVANMKIELMESFGIVMVVNLAIGFITPPLGINLFVASRVGRSDLETVCSGIIKFILVMVVDLLLITFIPAISMTLPNIFMK